MRSRVRLTVRSRVRVFPKNGLISRKYSSTIDLRHRTVLRDQLRHPHPGHARIAAQQLADVVAQEESIFDAADAGHLKQRASSRYDISNGATIYRTLSQGFRTARDRGEPMAWTESLDRLFIDADWVRPATNQRIEVVSPTTEEAIAAVPAASRSDIDRAVTAARHAFDHGPWPDARLMSGSVC